MAAHETHGNHLQELYNERSLFYYELFSGISWTWEDDHPYASFVELATA
jgi:hypothetical protein